MKTLCFKMYYFLDYFFHQICVPLCICVFYLSILKIILFFFSKLYFICPHAHMSTAHMDMCSPYCMCGGQKLSLLLPCGYLGLNSGCQDWRQAALLTELSH